MVKSKRRERWKVITMRMRQEERIKMKRKEGNEGKGES